jgi:hypothetical protein
MRTRITPSLVLSVLALTVSLGGGTAFAAHYIITSTKQLKPSVRRALKGNRGPAGPRGFPGLQGTQGPQGAAGPAGIARLITVQGATVTVPPGGIQSAFANCPVGSVATGAGGYVSIGRLAAVNAGGGSSYIIVNNDTSISLDVYAYVFCASGPGAGTAASARTAAARSSLRDIARADLARLRKALAIR